MNSLRKAMFEQGITIKEMSKKLGITMDALNKKLGGRREFKIREINILIDTLEKPYEDLFKNQSKKIS
jgi:transcriptional regulator with XRE-family HTH domain